MNPSVEGLQTYLEYELDIQPASVTTVSELIKVIVGPLLALSQHEEPEFGNISSLDQEAVRQWVELFVPAARQAVRSSSSNDPTPTTEVRPTNANWRLLAEQVESSEAYDPLPNATVFTVDSNGGGEEDEEELGSLELPPLKDI